MSAQWTTIQIPLASGMTQNQDDRALQAPALAVALDVEFEEVGGIQTRKPMEPIGGAAGGNVGVNIFGGGTLSGIQRVVANGDELLCFTVARLYSWNAQLSVWVDKGEHLAVKIDEAARFTSSGDQKDCDRAELNGTVVYAWSDATLVYAAALDKATGSVLMVPTSVVGSRPRLVATSTKILLFLQNSTSDLVVYALDPAAPATAWASSPTAVLFAPNFGSYYDVCRRVGSDAVYGACRRVTTTSYTAFVVTAGLVVTTSTKARTCDGPIAVSSDPTGSSVQVIRANATNIEGDLLTSSLADTYTGQAIGTVSTTTNQIAAAHRSVQNGGAYRCYVFWSGRETPLDPARVGVIKSNYVDTANAIGTQAGFPMSSSYAPQGYSLASRAFDYNGSVYVHLQFGGASFTGATYVSLQNTFFLYRDDTFLVAKEAMSIAGGFGTTPGLFGSAYTSTVGFLPGVALVTGTTGFAWCGTERRRVTTSTGNTYASRAPRDITITFNSNKARRTARIGETLYATGGEILQYDGVALSEVGFHIYPWYLLPGWTGGAGSLPAGNYTYKSTFRWDNAKGERDRSTTATLVTYTSGANQKTQVTLSVLVPTHKTLTLPASEIWRTVLAPPANAPFYLVTSLDPAATGNNGYLSARSIILADDNFTDTDLTLRESNPENGGVLESLSPPAAALIIATQDRVFLADVSGDPDRVWYSKLRGDGEVVSFNDALTIAIPREGGAITGLAILSETLVVFRERAVYAIPGDGFANDSSGQNYGPARLVAPDCGATSAEAIAKTEMGVVFKSSKGWYLLSHGWQVQYIGASVIDYDAESVLSVEVLDDRHQVRVLTASRMLVWDYLVNQWCEWTFAGGVSACMWRGRYVTARYNAATLNYEVVTEADDFSGSNVTYGIDVETPWIKPQDLQGRARVRFMKMLGEFRSACSIRVRVARDYKVRATAAVITTAISAQVAGASGVLTDRRPWRATISSVGTACSRLDIAFVTNALGSVEVRDNQAWNGTAWVAAVGSVGILVKGQDLGAQSVTVGTIEAAITATSAIATVSRHDDTAFKRVAISTLNGRLLFGLLETGIDWFDDIVWIATPTTVGGPLELRHGLTEGRCSAIKFRITARGAIYSSTTPPQREALKLTGLALDVAVQPGINRRLPAAQKA